MADAIKTAEVELAWLLHRQPKKARAGRFRDRLSAEQNHRCCYCGVRTNEARSPDHVATVEHVIPRSRGGPDAYWNLAMACQGCNSRRSSQWLPEHYAIARLLRPAH